MSARCKITKDVKDMYMINTTKHHKHCQIQLSFICYFRISIISGNFPTTCFMNILEPVLTFVKLFTRTIWEYFNRLQYNRCAAHTIIRVYGKWCYHIIEYCAQRTWHSYTDMIIRAAFVWIPSDYLAINNYIICNSSLVKVSEIQRHEIH